MEEIIIDTSSILFAVANKADIFEAAYGHLGLIPVISTGIVTELRNISAGPGPRKKQAIVAIKIIEKHSVKTYQNDKYVDSWILEASKHIKSVCTNDVKLRRLLLENEIKVYTMSKSGFLRRVSTNRRR